MYVDLMRYQAVGRSSRARMWGLLVGAAFTALFGGFWVLIGLFAVLVPEEPGDQGVGAALAIIGGGGPGVVTAILIFVAVRSRRRLRGLESIAMMVRKSGHADAASVSLSLGLGQLAAERLLFDAVALGILRDDPPPAQLQPAPPTPWSRQGAPRPVAPAPPPSGQGWGASPAAAGLAGTEPSAPTGRPSRASLVGTTLNGTYEIERLLGEGGMGEVYVARHVRTGRRYAVKALLPGSRFSDEAIRRFKREAAAASALGHPGIVAVHDFDVTPDGTHYLVCELLEGETLEDRLGREGALPWPKTAAIVRQVASALEAAHGAGVLHRDLKPGNVFLCTDRAGEGEERAVLLDFGLAKPLDDGSASKITTTGTVVGTPLYMSPEQARCEDLDVRSDVYSLGAVLYEMVTGAPPFVEATVASLYARLLSDPPRPPTEVADRPIPPELDDLLGTALAKDPGDRFGSVAAFGAALAAIEAKEVSRSGVRASRSA